MQTVTEPTLIQAGQLGHYFHQALHDAASERRLQADQTTLHYLTLLLCQYARSERLFDFDRDRLQLRPLAMVYAEAVAARSTRERRLWLQRLGDMALFVGGLFAGRLNRHFTDLEYCVAMGGNAYGYLEDSTARSGEPALATVFGELAARFPQFVDLVAVVTGRGDAPLPGLQTGGRRVH